MQSEGVTDANKRRQEEVWPPPPTAQGEANTATADPHLAKTGRRLILFGAAGILLSVSAGIFFTIGEAGRLLNHDSRIPSLTLNDEVLMAASMAFLTPPLNLGAVAGALLMTLGIFRLHRGKQPLRIR